MIPKLKYTKYQVVFGKKFVPILFQKVYNRAMLSFCNSYVFMLRGKKFQHQINMTNNTISTN